MFVQEGQRFQYRWQNDETTTWRVDHLREEGDYDCVVIDSIQLDNFPNSLKRARFSEGQINSCVFISSLNASVSE